MPLRLFCSTQPGGRSGFVELDVFSGLNIIVTVSPSFLDDEAAVLGSLPLVTTDDVRDRALKLSGVLVTTDDVRDRALKLSGVLVTTDDVRDRDFPPVGVGDASPLAGARDSGDERPLLSTDEDRERSPSCFDFDGDRDIAERSLNDKFECAGGAPGGGARDALDARSCLMTDGVGRRRRRRKKTSAASKAKPPTPAPTPVMGNAAPAAADAPTPPPRSSFVLLLLVPVAVIKGDCVGTNAAVVEGDGDAALRLPPLAVGLAERGATVPVARRTVAVGDCVKVEAAIGVVPVPATDFVTVLVGEGDGVGTTRRVAVGDVDGNAAEFTVGVADPLGGSAAVDVSVAVGLGLAGSVGAPVGECDGDAPRDSDGVGVLVPVGVGVDDVELVPVGLAVSVFVLDAEIGEVEADAVMDADAPDEREGVGDALAVDDALTVDDPLSEPVRVPLRVTVAVPESLLVGDTVGD